MQCTAMDHDCVAARNVQIGQVRAKQKIVGFDIRTEQERSFIPKADTCFRKVSRAIVEDTLFTHSIGMDVSLAVEYGEHCAVFENTGAVIPGRRFGRYVVLLGDVNFIQFSTPSTVESGAFLPLVSRS